VGRNGEAGCDQVLVHQPEQQPQRPPHHGGNSEPEDDAVVKRTGSTIGSRRDDGIVGAQGRRDQTRAAHAGPTEEGVAPMWHAGRAFANDLASLDWSERVPIFPQTSPSSAKARRAYPGGGAWT